MPLLTRLARLGACAHLQSLAPARLVSAVSHGLADKPLKAPELDMPPLEAAADLAPKTPKRALSAYHFYIKDAMFELKADMPASKQTDVMRAAVARYVADKKENPAALAKYLFAAVADKERVAAHLAPKPPKRALSAYSFYMKEALVELKADMPASKQTDVMRAAVARYVADKKENPAALAKYLFAAVADKERVAAHLAPKPPKRALSAYSFYMKEAMVELKADMPASKQTDVMRAAAARYVAVKKDNPAALAKYIAAAVADNERAAADLATWKRAYE
ncbi:hypothetical protein T492DRAFT_414134 [Pavlovales sp. CCMP2436]|nr:hypothetical protein T492DRAFT_414134 [Pavlovales sp. CCMP2436]